MIKFAACLFAGFALLCQAGLAQTTLPYGNGPTFQHTITIPKPLNVLPPSPTSNPYSYPSDKNTRPDNSKPYTPSGPRVPEEGFAIINYPSGVMYEGYFKNFEKSGNGLMMEGRDTIYNGEWAHDKYNGKGILPGYGRYVGNFADGQKSGQGTFTNPNGSKYEGHWAHDLKNGAGTYTAYNGDKFIGEWKNDLKDGPGVLYNAAGKVIQQGNWENDSYYGTMPHYAMPDGSTYYGDLKYNNKTGHGIQKYANGDIYDGNFSANLPNGKGTFTDAGGNRYEGDWKDGKREGQGTMTFKNGGGYVGYFKNDRYNGNGTETNAVGDKMTGEWVDGELNGKGAYTPVMGAAYTGDFKDGYFEGKGVRVSPDGTRQEGDWKGSYMNGQGIWTNANGERYEGAWKDGKRWGYGVYDSAGMKYAGEWYSDKRFGKGISTYADGSKFDGNWVANKKIGYGTLYDASGKILQQGEWGAPPPLKPINTNSVALKDLKKVMAAGTKGFKGAIGKVLKKEQSGTVTIKTSSSLITVDGGNNALEIVRAEFIDYVGIIDFEEEISFKNDDDRDDYMREVSSVLPASAYSEGLGKSADYPKVTLNIRFGLHYNVVIQVSAVTK